MCILAEIQQLGFAGVLFLVGFSGLFWCLVFSLFFRTLPSFIPVLLCPLVKNCIAAKSDDFRKAVCVNKLSCVVFL